MQQTKYTVYWKQDCPNCVKAKDLLKSKDIPFSSVEIVMEEKDEQNHELIQIDVFKGRYPTVRSVPVIIDNESEELLTYETLRSKIS